MSKAAFDRQRAALAIDGTAVEKHVLLVLATRANESGVCTPGIPKIAADTGLSERSVHRALVSLEAGKHIERVIKKGVGTVYKVHPCPSVTPDVESPLTDSQSTPDTVSSKQPRTPITPTKATLSSGKRATRKTLVPSNFQPVVKPKSITAKAMDDWPPGTLEEEVEKFIDRHTAEQTLSADWQASWRTWVKNWKKFNGRHQPHLGASAGRTVVARPSPALALLREAEYQECAERDQAFGGGAWPPLQAIASG